MIDLIIPIYNAKKTLEFTLMSIKIQTIVDKINIYLIDDASADKYDEILDNYKDLNITYKRLDTNEGPAVARQVGLNISQGEYIMFIDADDLFYDADSVKKLYNAIEEYDYAVGYTYEEKRQIKLANSSDLHGKIYRRKFLENNNIKFNKTRFHEDNYFNNLVLLCSPKENEIEDLVYIYIDNKESITNNSKEKEFTRLEIMLSNIKELLNEAKIRNCERQKVIFAIFTKIKYFNRIWNSFTEEQQNLFISWIKKYDLKIEKYINNENYEDILIEMANEYLY